MTITKLIDIGTKIKTILLRIDQGSAYQVEYRWQKVANRAESLLGFQLLLPYSQNTANPFTYQRHLHRRCTPPTAPPRHPNLPSYPSRFSPRPVRVKSQEPAVVSWYLGRGQAICHDTPKGRRWPRQNCSWSQSAPIPTITKLSPDDVKERYSNTYPSNTLCGETIAKSYHSRERRLVSNCIFGFKVDPLKSIDNCRMLKSAFATRLSLAC